MVNLKIQCKNLLIVGSNDIACTGSNTIDSNDIASTIKDFKKVRGMFENLSHDFSQGDRLMLICGSGIT